MTMSKKIVSATKITDPYLPKSNNKAKRVNFIIVDFV